MFSKYTLVCLFALLGPFLPLASAADGPTAAEVITRLIEGNKRFVAGALTHPHQTVTYRASLAAGQKPFVTILTCADSRVSPEMIFDLGLGDAFVCRVAGNVLDSAGLGSIEYAVEHLHTPLLIVLGHQKCGAVKAAVDGGHFDGHLAALVAEIAPAVAEARKQTGDLMSNAVRANVQQVVKFLSVSEPALTERLQDGTLTILGARYDIATGAVELFPAVGAAIVAAPTPANPKTE
jgi:carbonic anhydrase